MSLGLGLGLGLDWKWGDSKLLRDLSARSLVAGRHGSMSLTGGTGADILCPMTRSIVSGPCSGVISIPGFGPLTLYYANAEIVNLMLGMTVAFQSTITDSGLSQTITESTSTTNHRGTTAALSLSPSTTTRRSFVFSVTTGGAARDAIVRIQDDGGTGANAAGVRINSDGTISDSSAGDWSTANISVTALGGGRYRCVYDAVISATVVGTIVGRVLMVGGGTTYTGDGVSGVTIEADTLVSTISSVLQTPPGITKNSTRTEDTVVWTPGIPTPQIVDLLSVTWDPFFNGADGAAPKLLSANFMAGMGGASSNQPRLAAGSGQTLARDDDGVSKNDAITHNWPAAATMFVHRLRRGAADLEGYYGATGSGSPTALGTGQAATTYRIGHGSVGGASHSGAFNGLVMVPGGISTAAYNAFCRSLHLVGRAAQA